MTETETKTKTNDPDELLRRFSIRLHYNRDFPGWVARPKSHKGWSGTGETPEEALASLREVLREQI